MACASPDIRVELTHAANLEISCPEEFNVSLPNGQPIYLGRSANFRSESGGISINGRLFQTPDLSIHANGPFSLNKHHYRGNLRLYHERGMLEAINVLDLEKYISGVVGSEVSPRWPMEALKAQAVVARTYALKKMEEHKTFPFDIVGSTQDQAYEGVEGESSSTEEAVTATRGEVLLYQGALITAYYHADCGGRTEIGENVFPGPLPYLESVACPYGQDSPYRHWSKIYSLQDLSERLGKPIRGLKIAKDPLTGRVSRVLLMTSAGNETVTGHGFRTLLGTRNLRSTRFDMEEVEKTIYVSREETLPPRYMTEYISKPIMRSRKEAVTEPVVLNDKVDLMHHSGALVEVNVSSANPLVAISGGGFLYMVYRNLSARTLRTRPVPATIPVLHITQGPPRKRMVWVPMKVPVEVTFTGKGWGHGVGLCQWGSRGMALLGKSYQDILHYYYQNVELKKLYH